VGPSRTRHAHADQTQNKRTLAETRAVWQSFLASRNLHASKTREVVVDIFLETRSHVDLQSLFELARKRQPGVGFATVYRTMKLLEEAGIAHARHFGDARETLYEVAAGREHHDHLICERCGRIVEFVDPVVESAQDDIARRHGFTLSRHRHELYGICSGCRPSRKQSS